MYILLTLGVCLFGMMCYVDKETARKINEEVNDYEY